MIQLDVRHQCVGSQSTSSRQHQWSELPLTQYLLSTATVPLQYISSQALPSFSLAINNDRFFKKSQSVNFFFYLFYRSLTFFCLRKLHDRRSWLRTLQWCKSIKPRPGCDLQARREDMGEDWRSLSENDIIGLFFILHLLILLTLMSYWQAILFTPSFKLLLDMRFVTPVTLCQM